MRAVLRRITWPAVLLTQGLAVLFALVPWLEGWGQPGQPSLARGLFMECTGALFIMLGAFAADECVLRGWPVLRAFAVMLLAACLATAVLVPSHGLAGMFGTFFGLGAYWGTPMLVYLNRQSAARLLATVEAGELRRVQTERSLIESDLAAAQAQINPEAVLQQLARLRDGYAANDADADRDLERLIADLRATVARCGGALPVAP
jgi:hypothetical protein